MRNLIYAFGQVRKNTSSTQPRKTIRKSMWSKIHYIKKVSLRDNDDAEQFIQDFGWNENIKIGDLYINVSCNCKWFFENLKCGVVTGHIPDISEIPSVEVLKNIQHITFRCVGERDLHYAYKLHDAGIKIKCDYESDIISHISYDAHVHTDLTNCNKNAQEVVVYGEAFHRIEECFEYFHNIKYLVLVFTADTTTIRINNLDTIPNLCKLRLERTRTSYADIDEETNKSLLSIIERSTNLYCLDADDFNWEICDYFGVELNVEVLRGHHRLRSIMPRKNQELLNEAKKIDREFRYKYAKVATSTD